MRKTQNNHKNLQIKIERACLRNQLPRYIVLPTSAPISQKANLIYRVIYRKLINCKNLDYFD